MLGEPEGGKGEGGRPGNGRLDVAGQDVQCRVNFLDVLEQSSHPPSTTLLHQRGKLRGGLDDKMSEARRADKHSKARTAMLEEFERQKAELVASTEKNSKVPSERFTSKTDTIEESLKKNTVGLVSAEDFKKRREELEELKRREAAQTDELK